jgi:hypothetical protein
MRRLSAVFAVALLASCSSPPDTTTQDPGGKVDAPGSPSDPRCDTAALDDSGTCRTDDGRFAFEICCAQETTCDVAVEEPACLFGSDSREMKRAVYLSSSSTARLLEVSDVDDLAREQLEFGLEVDSTFGSVEEIFEFVDDDGIEVLTVEVANSDASYTHYRMFFGSTEVGYIFDQATGELAATIGDQDVNDCVAPLPAEFDFRCGASLILCDLTDVEINRCVDEDGHAMGCLDFHDDELLTSCCIEHDALFGYCEVIPDM